MKLNSLLCLLSSSSVASFAPPSQHNANNALFLSAEPTTETAVPTATAESSASTPTNMNDILQIPLSYNEMITQSTQAMSDAYRTQGMSRQIVRILLPRDASSDQLGVQFEPDAQMDKGKNDEMKLVPCDESWQGGIMQLYRAASPTTKDILRQLCPTGATTGVPPKIIEDRSVDESGVDGVGLFYTQSGSGSIEKNTNSGVGFGFFGESVSLPTLSENDMCVFVQPTQEVVDIVESLSTSSMNGSSQQSSPLIALLNPQWRNVDDALDSASKSDSVFGAFASFLGGKGSSLRKLEELGYRSTYTLEGYVCKGGNIRLLKRYDSDWLVFAENDNGDKYLKVGTSMERPTYQDVEKMLNDNGVGYKYERDLGLAGKF
mmetsp:Transcript_11215/g.24729  ORF Transcript_11215/g.24729 Transcript_11215/m.24729 type:complete len:376 (+) Transcript_11215:113-1240(+)